MHHHFSLFQTTKMLKKKILTKHFLLFEKKILAKHFLLFEQVSKNLLKQLNKNIKFF